MSYLLNDFKGIKIATLACMAGHSRGGKRVKMSAGRSSTLWGWTLIFPLSLSFGRLPSRLSSIENLCWNMKKHENPTNMEILKMFHFTINFSSVKIIGWPLKTHIFNNLTSNALLNFINFKWINFIEQYNTNYKTPLRRRFGQHQHTCFSTYSFPWLATAAP